MVETGTNSSSFLEKLARHERDLLAQVHDADLEASQAVETARAQADRLSVESAIALDADVARMRQEAEAERAKMRERILQAAQEQLSGTIAAARARVPECVAVLLSLVVPHVQRKNP